MTLALFGALLIGFVFGLSIGMILAGLPEN